MKINTDSKKIEEVLTRGVENIYPSKEALKKELSSGRELRIYNGIDPTGPNLHIGHSVVLRKLREFQDLGHQIILLIGDFTAMIGDPTDKLAARKALTREQVLTNCQNYKKQIGKILNLKKTEFRYNSEWLGKLSFAEILKLSSYFTAQQTLARDMFKKRIKEGKDLYLHEFLYPLMQAYDSVVLGVDLEIGGSDQMFNMLAGRTLMKKMKDKEKFVLTAKLLEDPTGKKMGKTEGNMIILDEKPEEMYGQVMSWPDGLILVGFELCTDVPLAEIKEMASDMKAGKVNPRDLKMRLGRELVTEYHSKAAAQKAEAAFKKVFQEKEAPEKMSNVKCQMSNINVIDLLVKTKLAASKGEARRLVKQGGVKVDGRVIKDANQKVKVTKDGVLVQKGKRYFIKVLLAPLS